MRFMNEYDVERALRMFDTDQTPNLAYAAESVQRLQRWANSNSDGWAYWPKPARSAARLMEMLDNAQTQAYNGTLRDVPKSDVTKALVPVKSFLTRQGVDHTLVIIR